MHQAASRQPPSQPRLSSGESRSLEKARIPDPVQELRVLGVEPGEELRRDELDVEGPAALREAGGEGGVVPGGVEAGHPGAEAQPHADAEVGDHDAGDRQPAEAHRQAGVGRRRGPCARRRPAIEAEAQPQAERRGPRAGREAARTARPRRAARRIRAGCAIATTRGGEPRRRPRRSRAAGGRAPGAPPSAGRPDQQGDLGHPEQVPGGAQHRAGSAQRPRRSSRPICSSSGTRSSPDRAEVDDAAGRQAGDQRDRLVGRASARAALSRTSQTA